MVSFSNKRLIDLFAFKGGRELKRRHLSWASIVHINSIIMGKDHIHWKYPGVVGQGVIIQKNNWGLLIA